MAQTIVCLFCITLLFSLIFHISIILALLVGLLLFLIYGFLQGHSPKSLLHMVANGIKKAGKILTTFILIGMMTALWRSCGTIPTIVTYSSKLLEPKILLVMIFLLNAGISFLTGTSFGTSATIGVICASVARSMQLDPLLTGGAILSGAMFGDRCSPVSTSMLLTADLTRTDPYKNIRTMFQTGMIPLLLSILFFAVCGFLFPLPKPSSQALEQLFAAEFIIHPVCLIPAAAILLLGLFHVPVRKVMTVSILLSVLISMFLQQTSITELPFLLLNGYHASDPKLAALINGGGIQSMLRCGTIVCISSAYAGIFEGTGLLSFIQRPIQVMAQKTNGFFAVMITSVFTSMAACNQTLSIMLTWQLCHTLSDDPYEFASWLENTVVVIAPLIPWSIAGSTILYTCDLPLTGILFAVYLYLLPICNLFLSFFQRAERKYKKSTE